MERTFSRPGRGPDGHCQLKRKAGEKPNAREAPDGFNDPSPPRPQTSRVILRRRPDGPARSQANGESYEHRMSCLLYATSRTTFRKTSRRLSQADQLTTQDYADVIIQHVYVDTRAS